MNHTTRSSSSWLLSQSQEEQQQRRSILLRRLLEETVREEVGMQPSYHVRTHQTTYRYQNPNYNAMLQQQQRMSEQLSLPRPTTPRATTVITPSQAYHCPSYSPNCTADDNATGEAESILENLAPHAIAPRGGGGTRSSNSLACNSHSNRQNIQGNLSLGVFDGVPANWFLPSRPTSDSTASSANTFQTVVTNRDQVAEQQNSGSASIPCRIERDLSLTSTHRRHERHCTTTERVVKYEQYQAANDKRIRHQKQHRRSSPVSFSSLRGLYNHQQQQSSNDFYPQGIRQSSQPAVSGPSTMTVSYNVASAATGATPESHSVKGDGGASFDKTRDFLCLEAKKSSFAPDASEAPLPHQHADSEVATAAAISRMASPGVLPVRVRRSEGASLSVIPPWQREVTNRLERQQYEIQVIHGILDRQQQAIGSIHSFVQELDREYQEMAHSLGATQNLMKEILAREDFLSQMLMRTVREWRRSQGVHEQPLAGPLANSDKQALAEPYGMDTALPSHTVYSVAMGTTQSKLKHSKQLGPSVPRARKENASSSSGNTMEVGHSIWTGHNDIYGGTSSGVIPAKKQKSNRNTSATTDPATSHGQAETKRRAKRPKGSHSGNDDANDRSVVETTKLKRKKAKTTPSTRQDPTVSSIAV